MGKLLDTLKTNGIDITEEIEKKVMEEFVERNEAELKDTEITNLKEQLKTRDKDIEELKKVDVNKLQESLTNLQGKYKTDTEALQEKLHKTQLENALEIELIKSNAKNTKAVKALLDMEQVKFTDGKLEGVAEQLEAVKKDNDYLFNISTDKNDTKEYNYQPGNGKSESKDSVSDFISIINANQVKRD